MTDCNKMWPSQHKVYFYFVAIRTEVNLTIQRLSLQLNKTILQQHSSLLDVSNIKV